MRETSHLPRVLFYGTGGVQSIGSVDRMVDLTAATDAQTITVQFNDGGEWLPLPAWATYLWQLGAAVGGLEATPGSRLRIAAAVPVRAMAALLLTAGFVVERSRLEQIMDAAKLPPGTSVIFTDKKGLAYEGRIAKPAARPTPGLSLRIQAAEGLHIELRYERGQRTTVRQTQRQVRFRPGQRRPRAVTLPTESTFLSAVLEGDASLYLDHSRPDATIVGTLCFLGDELRETQLQVGGHEGSLAELLRPRNVPIFDTTWHTQFATDRTLGHQIPSGMWVLDGVRHFVRNMHAARNVDWFAVLERSHPRFEEACNLFNDLRTRRVDIPTGLSLTDPPPGIEISAFREPVAR